MYKKLLTGFAGFALIASLTGCGVAGAPAAKDEGDRASASEPNFAPPAVADEPKDMTQEFGGLFTYDNGVAISASAPVAFEPSQYSAGADQAAHIQINLTITNGSNEPLEPAVYGTISSAGAEGSQIFDTDKGMSGGPTTVILPGGTITWSEAYSVADPASLILQIAPSFEYENAIFTLGN